LVARPLLSDSVSSCIFELLELRFMRIDDEILAPKSPWF
jgi:hypothetical protein